MKIGLMVVTCLVVMISCAVITRSQTDNSNTQADPEGEKIYKMSEVEEKPQIKKKPRAGIENSYGKCSGSGTVRLRVVLLKTAQIGDIKIASPSQCSIFDDNAVRTAKKIKFKPAVKNGQAVSVSVLVEFSYRVF